MFLTATSRKRLSPEMFYCVFSLVDIDRRFMGAYRLQTARCNIPDDNHLPLEQFPANALQL